MIPGIDVSHYQGVIDWAKVAAAGVKFAFLKCTEGVGKDPMYSANMATIDPSIIAGAYHFFTVDLPGDEQARQFLTTSIISPLAPSLYAVDLEQAPTDKGAYAGQALKFILAVEEATGKPPIVYGSPSFLAKYLSKANIGDSPLWIAEYGPPKPSVPAPWTDWVFWQHTSGGHMDGITTPVDLDWFNGDIDALRELELAS